MSFPQTIPALLAFLLLGAHCFRNGWILCMVLCLAAPILLFLGRRWALIAARIWLAVGTVEWLMTLLVKVSERRAIGAPWMRLALILGAVAAFTALAAWLLSVKGEKAA